MRVLSELDLIEEKAKSLLKEISELSLEYKVTTCNEPKYLELTSDEFEAVMKYIRCEYPCTSDLKYIIGLEVIIKD